MSCKHAPALRLLWRWQVGILVGFALGLTGVVGAEAAGEVTNCTSYGSIWQPGRLAWALQGGGTVTFACSGTIIVPEIVLTQDTVIDGTGQTVTLSGNGANRVLRVNPGATVEVKHITMTDGYALLTGGGISNQGGALSLTDSVVSGNSASYAGGIYNYAGTLTLTNSVVRGNSAESGGGLDIYDGTVTLTNSTVTGNSAADFGGGMSNHFGTVRLIASTVSGNSAGDDAGGIDNAGGLTLVESTVSGNSAAYYAGGIRNHGGTLTLWNSTVSGNQAGYDGGGIYNAAGTVAATSITVSGNRARSGGGIRNDAVMTLTNSIIANQGWGGDCYTYGRLVSRRYNLDSDGTCRLRAIGDISRGEAALWPLAMNPPGATATHALGPNSQARDAIPAGINGCGTTITTDQRGVERPQGSGCDMGAYEVSGAIEAVRIRRASFVRLVQLLVVSAASTASPEAELSLTIPQCLTDEPMPWSEDARGYVLQRRITVCGNLTGQTATVTSSHGGVASATIK